VPLYYGEMNAKQSSFIDHMRNIALAKDIDNSITSNIDRSIAANAYSIESINSRLVDMQIASSNAMFNNTQDMIQSFHSGLSGVSSQLKSGFSGVSSQIQSGFSHMSRQLGEMNASMNMSFAAMNSAVRESSEDICNKLDTLNEIQSNPSKTKARELFKIASEYYDKKAFAEAEIKLLEATKENMIDYFAWLLLGKTYFFGMSVNPLGEIRTVIDLDKAIDAVKNAATYISNEISVKPSKEARVIAGEIYFYLGIFLQTKAMDKLHAQNIEECNNYLNQAIRSYSLSWDYSAKILEALYKRASCKSLLGDVRGAIMDLETVILQDRNYCLKVCIDPDFFNMIGQFTALIKKLKNEKYIPAKNDYDQIKTILPELDSLGVEINVAIPEKFTEEASYFEVLDYSKEFRRLVLMLKKALTGKIAAIVEVRRQEDLRLEIEKNKQQKVIRLKEEMQARKKADEKEKKDEFIRLFGVIENKVTCYKGNNEDITIFDGITTIGQRAFYKEKENKKEKTIWNINIPTSVTIIEESAFEGNSLNSIKIPEGVKTIRKRAFSNNRLTNITLPTTITHLEEGVLSKNYLTSVTIPKGVTIIGDSAFENNKLNNIKIPEGVKTIRKRAFSNNRLTNITLPTTITHIGSSAFSGNELTNITIPPNMKSIESALFRDNCLTKITISEGIEVIGAYAFANNNITEINIPKSVKIIEACAFYNNQLTNLIISEGVIYIKSKAFFNEYDGIVGPYEYMKTKNNKKNNFKKINIPKSVKTIGLGAFFNKEDYFDDDRSYSPKMYHPEKAFSKIEKKYSQSRIIISIGSDVNLGVKDEIDDSKIKTSLPFGFDKYYNDNGKRAGKYTFGDNGYIGYYGLINKKTET